MSAKSIQVRHPFKTILLGISLGVLLNGCLSVRPSPPASGTTTVNAPLSRTDNMALGNPSSASGNNPDNYLIPAVHSVV